MTGGGSGLPWRDLAAVLLGLRSLLPGLDATDAVAPPGDAATGPPGDLPADTGGYVTDLLRYLTGQAGGDWVDTVAVRLFDLHVARYVMQPDGLLADQALELIQMSADTRTSLDPRTLAAEKLTGLQLHHFGAFCKASWRANDWMWAGSTALAGWCTRCSTRSGCTSWSPGRRPGRVPRRAARHAGADRGQPGAARCVDPVPGPGRPPARPG